MTRSNDKSSALRRLLPDHAGLPTRPILSIFFEKKPTPPRKAAPHKGWHDFCYMMQFSCRYATIPPTTPREAFVWSSKRTFCSVGTERGERSRQSKYVSARSAGAGEKAADEASISLIFPWGRRPVPLCGEILSFRRSREGKYLQWLLAALESDPPHPSAIPRLGRLLGLPSSSLDLLETEETFPKPGVSESAGAGEPCRPAGRTSSTSRRRRSLTRSLQTLP